MTATATSVMPDDLDRDLLLRLGRLMRRVQRGDRRYPALADIYEVVGAVYGQMPDPAAIVAAQQAWFAHGSSGCVFAGLAALRASKIGWYHVVITDPVNALSRSMAATVDALVEDAVAHPAVNILSIVFPMVSSEVDAVTVVDSLALNTRFEIERQHVHDDRLVLYVRRAVADQVVAWVMAFAPFASMPATRHAPFFELTIRVKPKSGPLYARLTHDRAAAHLADVPLTMPAKHWDHRWDSTRRKTRQILGHEPDELSAARSTLSVPMSLLPLSRVSFLIDSTS